MNAPLLQIVPRLPGAHDAVGDHAATLAAKLQTRLACETAFMTADMLEAKRTTFDHVILHYVNYGYHPRGVPRRLLSILRELRGRTAKFITIFHELYASSPPWRSAFWLRRAQMRIARDIAQLSDDCIVTNEITRAQLLQLAPSARVSIHPVFSNFGEPELSREQIAARVSHRWAICGGTAAIVRALQSFSLQHHRLRRDIAAKHLHIVGGTENDDVRKLIVDLAPIQIDYRPNVSADDASNILRECSFAWFDYFHGANVPGPVILKSSAFAAACAHAVVPVFPHPVSRIAAELPETFSISNLSSASERAHLAAQFYDWYKQHASSDHLARAVAEVVAS